MARAPSNVRRPFRPAPSGASIAYLVGSAVGLGAATGLMGTTPRLSGTAVGASSATGSLRARSLLTGAAAGAGSATGALRATVHLTGSAAGVGASTGAIRTTPRFVGLAAGVGIATGLVRTVPRLSGSAAGIGSATGLLSAIPRLSGSAIGVSSSTGLLKVTVRMTGSAAGVGSANGTLTYYIPPAPLAESIFPMYPVVSTVKHGNWAYAAGTSPGTVDVPANARLRSISIRTGSGQTCTFTIAGGNPITVPPSQTFELAVPGKALGADVVISGDLANYYVSWSLN